MENVLTSNVESAVEQSLSCTHCGSRNTEAGWTANVSFRDGREFKLIGVWCFDCDDINEDFEANREYHEAQAEEAAEWWKYTDFKMSDTPQQ